MALVDLDPVSRAVRLNFHQGQREAYQASERFILLLAGTRGGKTACAPWWLLREIQRQGEGDYLIAAPSYTLLDKAAVPELRATWTNMLGLGRVVGNEFRFDPAACKRLFGVSSTRTRVVFGHADNPDSLEALTAKAAWLDEAGQRQFKQGSWEAILRRLSIHRGRVLITSTPYLLAHWLKTDVADRAARRGTPREKLGDSDYRTISFESRMNPAFPPEEWDRAKASLPEWKFDLFYRGIFTRPAGLIYDCFDTAKHVIDPFPVPANWTRRVGIDFGGVNTAAVVLAENPDTRHHVVIAEYHRGGLTAAGHSAQLRELVGGRPEECVGGSWSEGQWRAEFRSAGWPVREPDQPDVEVGIDRVTGLIKTGRLTVFRTCERLIGDLTSYSRKVNDAGEVTEVIEDKASFHLADSLRYIGGWIARPNRVIVRM